MSLRFTSLVAQPLIQYAVANVEKRSRGRFLASRERNSARPHISIYPQGFQSNSLRQTSIPSSARPLQGKGDRGHGHLDPWIGICVNMRKFRQPHPPDDTRMQKPQICIYPRSRRYLGTSYKGVNNAVRLGSGRAGSEARRNMRLLEARLWRGLFVAELCVCLATVILFGFAYPDRFRTQLWQNGGDEGWNSDPKQRIYFYANYKTPPEIPLIWSQRYVSQRYQVFFPSPFCFPLTDGSFLVLLIYFQNELSLIYNQNFRVLEMS